MIREAIAADAAELAVLMTHLTGNPVAEEVMLNRLAFVESSPFDSLYVYEDTGRLLGLFGFRIRENLEAVSRYGEISSIVVSPEARGQGIGRQLMDYAEQLAVQYGCIGTWLVSGFGRAEEAHKFYKQLKYEITGYRFRKLN
ncbi:aminoalkylphosphonic acid N-acetyltransferase [compost metagenome]